ncbi:MAG: carbamoyltransferase HypF [Bacillota bacterium]
MGIGKEAWEVKIFGIVQGVGFRPHVYKLSKEHGLHGWVLNNSEGVVIHWEGEEEVISRAFQRLLQFPPPLARIAGHEIKKVVFFGYSNFFIQESHAAVGKKVLIAPDVGICDECARELQDPADVRHNYPFINCTNCGPRFTIIQDRPYDRHLTTMKAFEMCQRCRSEYENPLDRRFHAQPNACSECGPRLMVIDNKGCPTSLNFEEMFKSGSIVAVKGLGGFHLFCNAFDEGAVARLRKGKERDGKPFALMAASLEIIRRCCRLSDREEEYLVSPARPIVVLKQRKQEGLPLPASINPGLDTLGVMLPYTPLHMLLFSPEMQLLVATSANLSSNPLITANDEAFEKLKGLADYFVMHNREIENPCDDTVGMVLGDEWQFIRKARGYVPLPVSSRDAALKPTLACGGSLKSTFALAAGDQVFLSQHLGDLDNYLNFKVYEKTLYKMIKLLEIEPGLVVCDLHPGYHSSHYAEELAAKWQLPLVKAQHHHAHMASCMADNGLGGQVMAVSCDGTGYGTDGAIWGCEFLYGDYRTFKRAGHLSYVPLPGGEASIQRPARMAYSYLISLLGERGRSAALKWLKALPGPELKALDIQLAKGLNTVQTSSAGRLFDAVAALLGICAEQVYDGQGPMEMEALADKWPKPAIHENHYRITIQHKAGSTFELDTTPLWDELIYDMETETPRGKIAYKFHQGFAAAVKEGILCMSKVTGLKRVVLSGGVFQNRLLVELLLEMLKTDGIEVFLQKQVPANDGGLALGQVFIGNEVSKNVPGSTL